MVVLLNAIFLAVSISHLGVDLLNGSVPVMLAFLSVPLGLTNTSLGAISTGYSFIGALSQPIFGYIADRVGPRWVVSASVLLMGVAYTAAIFTPGMLAIVLLLVASVGSGAFHPAGTMQATLTGRTYGSGRETTSTSYFFLLGQLGLFLGPLLGGLLLNGWGKLGLLLLPLPAFPIALFAAWKLASIPAASPASAQPPVSLRQVFQALAENRRLVLVLALLAALRIWVQTNMTTFMPKYLSDLEFAPAVYGLVASLFMAGIAFGNVFGGTLADRFGKRWVAFGTLLGAILPFLILPQARTLEEFIPLVIIAGLLVGASHSIVVVSAQHLIPGGMGLASGLILGFMFASGALGVFFSGILADQFGIPVIFTLSAGLCLLAALLTPTLEK